MEAQRHNSNDVEQLLNVDSLPEHVGLEVLRDFNLRNATVSRFVSILGGVEAKESFLTSLVHILGSPDKSLELKRAALESIKLCCREKHGCTPVYHEKVLQGALEFANINGWKYEESFAVEALKALVNLVVLNPTINERFASHRPFSGLYAITQREGFLESPLTFPVYRLMLQLSLDEGVLQDMLSGGVLDVAAKALEHSMAGVLKEHRAPTAEETALGQEALKLLCKMTLPLGPLATPSYPQPLPNIVNAWAICVPYLAAIMHLPVEHHQLKHYCVNSLVNTPRDCAHLFHVSISTLNDLLQFLEEQLDLEDQCDDGQLAPILMVLITTTRSHPSIRNYLLKKIFPHAPKQSKKPSINPPLNFAKNRLGARLAKHMTSVNDSVKTFVNEFLIALTNEDLDQVVELTGFGNAAGIIAHRSMMALSGFGGEHNSGPVTFIPPADGEVVDDEPDKDDEEEPEEKEAERPEPTQEDLEKLERDLARLEELGIFKVMPYNPKGN